MRLLIALAALLLSMASAFAQGAEERRYFDDWLAACRADGYCSATAYQNPNPGGGAVADYVFRIGRHAEQIYWELSFTTVATMGMADQAFTIQVDTEAQTFRDIDEVGAYGSVNDFYFLGQGAQQVMDWLAPAKALTVGFVDTDNHEHHVDFSLTGLTAALVWIDEEQKRLGSERVAEAAPSGLPPIVAIAPNTAIPPAALAWLAADGECREGDAPTTASDIIELSETRRAFILPCWSAAYNTGAKVFIEDGGIVSQAFFPEFAPERGWTATDYLINYDYDPRTGTISTFYRGTGMGNCGSIGRYVWGEYSFKLVEFRSQDDCDSTGLPGDFPLVYSAGPAPMAAVARELPQGLFDAHGANTDCPIRLDETTVGAVVIAPINATQTYYSVRCAEYEGEMTQAVYVEDGGEFYMQRFLEDDGGELYRTFSPYDPVFDPATGRLTTHHFLDASKTCGTIGVWKWNGTDFEQVERRAKYDCDGKPGEWPIVEPEFKS